MGHHHDHDHAPAVTAGNERRLLWVFLFTAGYALVQAVGGGLSGSLALIADAGHMVSDAAALLLALIAYRAARRPADAMRTFGSHRLRVLAALANGVALLLLVIWIVYEAILRIGTPSPVMAGPMLIVAIIGLGVNLAGAWILMRGGQNDSNLRGALLHVMGDLLGSVGAIVAAIGIMLTGWTVLDPILSVFVALLVVRAAWRLVSESLHVLLQAAPKGLNTAGLLAEVGALPELSEVGHFHAWTLTDDVVVATLHVTAAEGVDPLDVPPLVANFLHERFKIDHVTVQVDRRGALQAAKEI